MIIQMKQTDHIHDLINILNPDEDNEKWKRLYFLFRFSFTGGFLGKISFSISWYILFSASEQVLRYSNCSLQILAQSSSLALSESPGKQYRWGFITKAEKGSGFNKILSLIGSIVLILKLNIKIWSVCLYHFNS